MATLRIEAAEERWPLARPFVIARGAKTRVDTVAVSVELAGYRGHGEGVPYARYSETAASVLAEIRSWSPALHMHKDAATAQSWLLANARPGAARQALDCALWDLRAKQERIRIWELIGCEAPRVWVTATTIGLASPSEMKQAASHVANHALLKVKLGAGSPLETMQGIRAAAPGAEIVADVNEGWDVEDAGTWAEELTGLNVACLEQPIASACGAALPARNSPPIYCADESFHTFDDWNALRSMYGAVNVKLDKVGGLSAGLSLCAQLREREIPFMIGCMVSSSLSIAPALLLAAHARWIDLDGPAWLAHDRPGGFRFENGWIGSAPSDQPLCLGEASPWPASLWG
jgi:L-alanine-DL-glutamate epimerase-like enolase superfamily enzyme